jgi:hypothetical protein
LANTQRRAASFCSGVLQAQGAVELRLENPEARISFGNLRRDDSRAGLRLKL